MKKIAFDNDKYIELQTKKILERISHFDKLYLEFGGKLFDDSHASRVLPGFLPDTKLQMLLRLKDKAEIIIVINANDIESNKIRGDLDIGYDSEVLRLRDSFEQIGLNVTAIVITQFDNQPSAVKFAKYLDNENIKNYKTYDIEGYPNNVQQIVSEEGFGRNDCIETTKPLVVVTAPGPGSGKLATCLSQMYLDHRNGINAGYAKFETFPVWNLPLKHPINMAYEAATADLNDINMIDPYHLEAYGEMTVNYNRDVEAFPILKLMFEKIMGKSPYKSPTDMGVNMVGFCIADEQAAIEASKAEIIRRYYTTLVNIKLAKEEQKTVEKIESLMSQLNIEAKDRLVATKAIEKAEKTNTEVFAIELDGGQIVTGKKSDLLAATSACVLNALKTLAKINDEIPLLSPHVIEPVVKLKTEILKEKNTSLSLDEVLTALSMSATTNPLAQLALQHLPYLKGLEAHSSVILDSVDKNVLRKLKMNYTEEPIFGSSNVYDL
ncbi:MAG: DUF1846 domain-containing protein [Peptoniphilaceae bacterium]|nr:DUF1846 domain-containing protein [Peptoniphilaceae bacterium]MDY6019507.1 DUF1846 domain-containing protein [Anaerococcus sp.]